MGEPVPLHRPTVEGFADGQQETITEPETLRNPPFTLEEAQRLLGDFYRDNRSNNVRTMDVKAAVNAIWNLSFKDPMPVESFFEEADMKANILERDAGASHPQLINELTAAMDFVDQSKDGQIQQIGQLLHFTRGPEAQLTNIDAVRVIRHTYFVIAGAFHGRFAKQWDERLE